MKHHELQTDIEAPPEKVWDALLALPDWPRWNALVPEGSGVVSPGQVLSFRIRVTAREIQPPKYRPHRPTVLVVHAPGELVMEATFGARWLVHMVHSFYILPTQTGCRLRQTWATSGILVPLLWPLLRRAQDSFAELGDDLARFVGGSPPSAPDA